MAYIGPEWNNVITGNPNAGMDYAIAGAKLQTHATDALTKVLNGLNKPMSKEEAIRKILGKNDTAIIPNRKRRSKRTKRKAVVAPEVAENQSVVDVVDAVGQIPEIDHIEEIDTIDPLPQIPEGFPDGTEAIAEGTYRLPDGRMVRKIQQEVDNEQDQTA